MSSCLVQTRPAYVIRYANSRNSDGVSETFSPSTRKPSLRRLNASESAIASSSSTTRMRLVIAGGRSSRQVDPDHRPVIRLAADGDPAAVELDRLRSDRQAEPEAASVAARAGRE